MVDRIAQRDADDVALADAERVEMRRPAAHDPVEVAIEDDAIALDDGRAIGARAHVVRERVGEVHHASL